MAVKKYNPVTPGTRFRIGNAYTEVTTNIPEKSLVAPMKSTGGR
ncbi:MAG TPA: 50S ribosomal protein L2, partial [Bacteroidetes bacterium]|nr:50S ribosomal protein L2 [Bacteroidota bacterium]